MKGTITVILEVKDEEKAREIWKAHGEGTLIAGCQVNGIGNGDYFKKVRAYEDGLNDILKASERHTGTKPVDDILDIIDQIPV